MSKGLEALKELGNETVATKDRNTIFMNETVNNSYTHLTQIKNINKTCYETIEKELRVLDIIKNKSVDMSTFGAFETYKDYEHFYNMKFHLIENEMDKLDEKEFNLLKEVLE